MEKEQSNLTNYCKIANHWLMMEAKFTPTKVICYVKTYDCKINIEIDMWLSLDVSTFVTTWLKYVQFIFFLRDI